MKDSAAQRFPLPTKVPVSMHEIGINSSGRRGLPKDGYNTRRLIFVGEKSSNPKDFQLIRGYATAVVPER